MKNIISERVADFLKKYPPFNELHEKDLQQLSQEVTIVHRDKGQVVFSGGETAHPHFYVVHKGAVELRNEGNNEVIDLCDEGDIFGLRPLLAKEEYILQAKAYEESILYAIPIETFKPYTQTYEEIGNFLIESFASNTRSPYAKLQAEQIAAVIGSNSTLDQSSRMLDFQPVSFTKKPVCCKPQTTAKAVAEIMTKKKVGSVLVVEDKFPLGIITDKDLRNNIVTGKLPVTAEASEIMSSPVITYPANLTVTQAQMAMMKSGISHLCLTADGTTDSKIVGVISKNDLIVALGNNPSVLIKAVKRATKVKQVKAAHKGIMRLLQGYLDNNIPMSITLKIISELNDACVKQVIHICLEKMHAPPPVPFAWLAMGSQGRREQLLKTDQDNAIIYQDVEPKKEEATQGYFLKFATKVNKALQQIGYEYCPAEMMASNPDWCKNLAAWKLTVSGWISNPGKEQVLLSSIFFDYNSVYGDSKLVDQLSQHIFEATEDYPKFFYHLAEGALQNPSPSGFFRDFLVEQDGAHKDFFDLKRRALMPLTDAARVLILSQKIKSISGTVERYEKMAELEENNRELYLSCSYATKALLKFRAKQGMLHHDSGRFIALNTLSKEEKIKLKRTFKTIKEIQTLIAVRFKVSNKVV
ncbi:DUF294 nucleotidyltransferase-like domain-containing protein [Zeaxanthinibacter sp. PT1]|uniref:DUF294 nucleotidyltransferase-like domain-containing protein n=1 Tax=Zeaxanthinibacter TaxID=561554 RepID=UPI0023496580|nr:DUF294 nucleotidyltransferase-like domain-containing protein [Zeaxanthinibacter sp. PT1]MDC6351325.1 DUF294 nucleotidyltransferase-like domain-containing protein [Zeaxanthinibacter sp. PT1]